LDNERKYGYWQMTALVILRVLIGWHFLYEGISKLLNPYWTSAGYLLESKGLFSDVFSSLASNSTLVKIVDLLNIWGLIAIGLGLMLGCLTRMASSAGILILLLYYLSNPPLIGVTYSAPAEGSYLLINKNLIEMAALAVLLLFPTGRWIGLDAVIFRRRKPVQS
jgi:thiosulfate dehydrogenase (quinone) large subunit